MKLINIVYWAMFWLSTLIIVVGAMAFAVFRLDLWLPDFECGNLILATAILLMFNVGGFVGGVSTDEP